MRVLELIERRCLAPLTRNGDVRGNDERTVTLSYKKLPQLQLIKLSVLKLDGSVFEIHVGKTATIAQLKQIVEEVFSSLQGKIPWSLVWGHFCLCHEGQKLTNDRAYIRNLGIKDGDQLQFIRHMSISNFPLKKGSKDESVPCKQRSISLRLSSGSKDHEEEGENGLEDYNNDAIQEDNSKHHPNEGLEEEGPVPEFKLAHFVRGWISCSKIVGSFKKGIRRQESTVQIRPAFLCWKPV